MRNDATASCVCTQDTAPCVRLEVKALLCRVSGFAYRIVGENAGVRTLWMNCNERWGGGLLGVYNETVEV